MSGIITQGYGPNQRIILEGYGQSLAYLTIKLYQTLLFSQSFATRWNALRTFRENIYHADGLIKRTEFRLLESMVFTQVVTTFKTIVEAVAEVVRRFIPIGRAPFKVKIPIRGTTLRPFRGRVPMYGDLFYPKQLGVDVKGSLIFPFHRTISLYGDKSFPFVYSPSIQGSPVHPSLLRTKMYGDLSASLKEKTKVKGEKDFIEIIKEILEEED